MARQCKVCVCRGRKDWYQRNRERAIAQSNAWIAANRERFNARARRNSKKPENMERQRRKIARYQREMKPFYLRGLAKTTGTTMKTTKKRILLSRTRHALVFLMAARQIARR